MLNLSFTNLLRIGLPGVLCVAVAMLVFPGLRVFAISEGPRYDVTALLILLALLIGALLYSLHRALPYPIVIYCLHRLIAAVRRIRDYDTEAKITDAVLRFRHSDKIAAMWLSGWPDQTHFLWTSAWGVALGTLVPKFFGEESNQYLCGALGFAALLFFAGLVDDFRYIRYQLHRMKKAQIAHTRQDQVDAVDGP